MNIESVLVQKPWNTFSTLILCKQNLMYIFVQA